MRSWQYLIVLPCIGFVSDVSGIRETTDVQSLLNLDDAAGDFADAVLNNTLNRSNATSAGSCPGLPFLSPYLKRTYKMTMAISAHLLDKLIQKEGAAVLKAMGFSSASIAEKASVSAAPGDKRNEIKLAVTRVTVSYKGVELGKDVEIRLTLVLSGDEIGFKDVSVGTSPPDEKTEAPSEQVGWFRRAYRYSKQLAVTTAMDVGLKGATWITLDRNMCMKKKAGTFSLQLSELAVDQHGDLGIGITFHENGCEGKWKDLEAPFLDQSKDNILKYVGDSIESDEKETVDGRPPSERARFGIFFEDGLVEKLSADQGMGMLVDGFMKAHGVNPLNILGVAHAWEDTQLAAESAANIVNTILKAAGVASNPRLKQIKLHMYRETGLFGAASYTIFDFTNEGAGIIDSVFTDEEKKVWFGPSTSEGPEVPSSFSFGECK